MSGIKLSIYKKLLILFLALSLLPLIALGIISYHYTRQTLQNNIEHNLQELARLAMEQVDQQLAHNLKEIKVWAEMEVMQDVLTADADGRITATLMSLEKSRPFHHRIHCLDRNGEIVASSEPQFIGKAKAEAEYFKQAVTGEAYISEPARLKGSQDVIIIISAPIRAIGNNQRIIGALSVSLDWEHIYPLLEGIRLDAKSAKQTKETHLMLINREGWVLFAPEFERQPGTILGENLFASGIFSSGLSQKTQTGYVIQVDEHNQLSLIGYARSAGHEDYPGMGWTTLALENLNLAFVPVFKLRKLFLISFVILALVIIVTAHLFARQLTEPVKSLTLAARRIAQLASESKDISTESIQVKSSDEVSELAESFQHMAYAIYDRNQRLQASYQELEGYNN